MVQLQVSWELGEGSLTAQTPKPRKSHIDVDCCVFAMTRKADREDYPAKHL